MRSLSRAYGRWVAGAAALLAAAWVLGMILVPLGAMLELSLWRLERPRAAAAVSARIDRLYNELATAELDAAALPEGDPGRAAAEAGMEAARAEIAALEAREVRPARVYGAANYLGMSGLHLRIFLRTILNAALVTALALVACYPVAYAMAVRAGPRGAALLAALLLVPYAINELLRTYAWLMILDYRGVLNALLDRLGLVDLDAAGGGVPFLESPGATFAAMVYAYVLFMAFPIRNALETLDKGQLDAARDLGASPWRVHRRVAIPHAKPGIAVGCVMVFMLSAGSYAVPQIMARGTGGDWFTQLIYRQFYEAADWNVGAAYAFALLAACVAFVLLVMALFRVGVRDVAR